MSHPNPKVIVVEDEANLRRFVRLALEAEGCDVFEADSVKRGLIETGTRKPDLLVLDLGLPDGDGIDLIRELRTWSEIPIIVLSARTAEAEKVAALDAGADDYLTKPFGAAELLARIRAHLRRRQRAGTDGPSQVEFGAVKIDLGRRLVEKDGAQLHLTPIEFRLLAYLLANPDCVLTHRQLLKAVWGPSHAEDSHYVRVYMGQLRKKLEADPANPDHIVTEPGIGYRFVAEP
ncbi:MAG TPA: two-component system response regulator KdpE [Zoogloea sp.]|jgi:two-component system KDP operon response regulator KdpE|uniref:two-component system response regulator KdpE n=1 Tax=Zoogloea sp. TaxID=49181 RepID=UPI002BB1A58A|nr:two-component system response regulator KdpE [Zoogloea sp.]HOB45089.1 two-component system response regulator KdpE [Zoogloea sp.]HQA09162.1 two-component system response regulator KdpE [Zoogloea sp.]HQE39352.1 two-component system response regulator KdpE [Zoogloea sp.]